MTNVALRSFVSTAHEAGSGEIRLAKGTSDQLVNKGTLGNRVASFFQDAARAIGLMKPDPTRAQRQQSALDGFKDALENHFGKGIADAALQATGLDTATRLTGRAVAAAIDNAKTIWAQNRAANLAGIQSYLPPGPGEAASPTFAELAASLKPPLDPADLTATQRLEFATRLRESVQSESRLNRQALDGGKLAGIAKDTLKQVLKLSQANGLDAATSAREAFTAAMKDVLKGLATGKDASTLTARITTALDRFADHAKAERIDEVGGGEFLELTEKATLAAMRELKAEDPTLLRKAQANALKDDSPLRALSAAAQNVVSTMGFEEGAVAEAQRETAGRLFSLGNSVVTSLASVLSEATGSSGGDLDRLNDDSTIPPTALQKAKNALQAAMTTI
jgi:hypothetical protein